MHELNAFEDSLLAQPAVLPVYQGHLEQLLALRRKVRKTYARALKLAEEVDRKDPLIADGKVVMGADGQPVMVNRVSMDMVPAYVAVALKAAGQLEARVFGKPLDKSIREERKVDVKILMAVMEEAKKVAAG